MCLACDMEALWFTVMEAPTGAAAAEAAAPPTEPAALLPSLENGRIAEWVAGGTRGAPVAPHPNPPVEGGGGSRPAQHFSCEETPGE
jgi:hypothetical protein